MSKFALTLLLGSVSFIVTANQPHVHGKANLDLVYSQNEVHIEFRTPMANLLGFEYKPQSKIEVFKFKEALTRLESDNAIEFSGISCEPEDVEIITPWEGLVISSLAEDADQHAHEHEHSHNHDDEHEHSHKHDGDHEHSHNHDGDHEHSHKHGDHKEGHKHEKDHHDSHHHSDEEHAEVSVQRHYSCKATSGKFVIEFAFINWFPKLEEIQLNWITDSEQGTAQLNHQSKQLELN